jgi:hypothetical protein
VVLVHPLKQASSTSPNTIQEDNRNENQDTIITTKEQDQPYNQAYNFENPAHHINIAYRDSMPKQHNSNAAAVMTT